MIWVGAACSPTLTSTHADFPLVDRFPEDITRAIKTGERVTVEPARGRVTVEVR